MSVESHSQDALPVVLVLGRKLEPDGSASPDLINRVDLARDVALRIGPRTKIVCSGGKLVFAADRADADASPPPSEAAVMRELLLDVADGARTVASDDILLDEQSTHTLENAVFARRRVCEILAGAQRRTAHIHLVTSEVHMRRARACFEGVFLRNGGGGGGGGGSGGGASSVEFELSTHASADGARVIPSEREGEIERAMLRRLPHDLRLYEGHDVLTARRLFFTPNPEGPDGEPHPHTWLHDPYDESLQCR